MQKQYDNNNNNINNNNNNSSNNNAEVVFRASAGHLQSGESDPRLRLGLGFRRLSPGVGLGQSSSQGLGQDLN